MNAHPEGMARIECTVDGDHRLIAGAAMIVAHVARRAGLATGAASDFAEATVQACRAVADLMEGTGSHTIRLAASELPNRIEVSVEPQLDDAGKRQLSSKRSGQLADRIRQALKSTTDGVNVQVQEGFSRVTLVKGCGIAKHPFAV